MRGRRGAGLEREGGRGLGVGEERRGWKAGGRGWKLRVEADWVLGGWGRGRKGRVEADWVVAGMGAGLGLSGGEVLGNGRRSLICMSLLIGPWRDGVGSGVL